MFKEGDDSNLWNMIMGNIVLFCFYSEMHRYPHPCIPKCTHIDIYMQTYTYRHKHMNIHSQKHADAYTFLMCTTELNLFL